jgi:hypothetical protein
MMARTDRPDRPHPFGCKVIEVTLPTWKVEEDAEEDVYLGADCRPVAAN